MVTIGEESAIPGVKKERKKRAAKFKCTIEGCIM